MRHAATVFVLIWPWQFFVIAAAIQGADESVAIPSALDTRRGDRMFADYLRDETTRLRDRCLADIRSLENWQSKRGVYRRQLFEMLGLDPLPARSDLQPVVTGRVEHDEFTVERLQFQSQPGLFVTANLYLPKSISEPVPAILYLCGHGAVKKGDTSYGNKVHYQHHGAWFARHGYACLILDSLQLGEIEGIHHGTHRYGMWWWLNRGYTPAGVEAWNCIRALDYLQSRPEIDGSRIGCSGRSGGGAYSWWIAALDERIRAAVPVAGITDLQNHIPDGCVDGHCDCMFMVNAYGWDYPLVAALVAPRPLLISNTDRDPIFPVDGVFRTYQQVRRIYELHGAGEQVALQITAGGHKDSQELQIHAMRWFDQHLKKQDRLIEKPAVKFFEPEALRVFDRLPDDQCNTAIHDSFVPPAPSPALPRTKAEWEQLRESLRDRLMQKVFSGWPQQAPSLSISKFRPALRVEVNKLVLRAWDYESQAGVSLRCYAIGAAAATSPKRVKVVVLDTQSWPTFVRSMEAALPDALGEERQQFVISRTGEANEQKSKVAQGSVARDTDFEKQIPEWLADVSANETSVFFLSPRGVGLTATDAAPAKQTQLRRRLYLLGQTLEGMQVYDIVRGLEAQSILHRAEFPTVTDPPRVELYGRSTLPLYAAALAGSVRPSLMQITAIPGANADRPTLLNVDRVCNLDLIAAMALEHCSLDLGCDSPAVRFDFAKEIRHRLGWSTDLRVRSQP